MCCVVSACSWLKIMAEYTVTSLLRSDGSVQTTSRVTLEHLPNFINGNEMQMFIRTHGLVHQHSVQSHGSSRDTPALGSEANVRAVRNHAGRTRSRSPRSRHSRIKLTSGPQGKSEMRRTGENGKVMGDVLMMIEGDPARLRCLPLKLEHPRTTLS